MQQTSIPHAPDGETEVRAGRVKGRAGLRTRDF